MIIGDMGGHRAIDSPDNRFNEDRVQRMRGAGRGIKDLLGGTMAGCGWGGVNCCGFIQDGGLTLHLLQRQGHTYFTNDALLYVRLAEHITTGNHQSTCCICIYGFVYFANNSNLF